MKNVKIEIKEMENVGGTYPVLIPAMRIKGYLNISPEKILWEITLL